MIVYDLKCPKDHVFEAWFADSAAFDRQAKRGAVSCPLCGSTKVAKALMAPNVATGNSEKRMMKAKRTNQALARYMSALHKVREHIEHNCDYVGDKFAEEARKIHFGEVDSHDIYGEATEDESRELEEEGIEVESVPWPARHDS